MHALATTVNPAMKVRQVRAWARQAQVPHEGDAQAAQHARALAQAEHMLQLRALARLERACKSLVWGSKA